MTDYHTEDQWAGTEENTLNIQKLLQMLKSQELQGNGWIFSSTIELIIVQCVLVALLLVVCVCWALYCRKRSNNPTVVEALKKLSEKQTIDYLSSTDNSKVVSSHQGPDDHPKETLEYLDLEAGHRRMSRLSFGSSDGVPSRISVGSCGSCSGRSSRNSLSSKSPASSRRESTSLAKSRPSLSEEYSTGSLRRLSTNTLFNLLSRYNSTSRKQSESNDVDRRSSLILPAQRKNGSQSNEVIINNLDETLHKKLSSIENLAKESVTQPRVCDVIKEEK